jgi:hypothetical protein
LDLKLVEPKYSLSGADGSTLKVTGMSNVCIKSTYQYVDVPVYVVKGSKRNLLGLPELRQLNLLSAPRNIVKAKTFYILVTKQVYGDDCSYRS